MRLTSPLKIALPLAALLALAAHSTARADNTQLCGVLQGPAGSGTTEFTEDDNHTLRLQIDVRDLPADGTFDVLYNGEVVAQMIVDGGQGRVRFDSDPQEDALPVPPAVAALRSGDHVQVAGLSGRIGQVGDMNADCNVNNFDIDPFVLALTNPAAFAEQFPRVNPQYSGDANGDGVLNNFDIDAFVLLLTT